MLTRIALWRYPPQRVGVSIRGYPDDHSQPPTALVVDRVRVQTFSLIVLIIGISAFTADNKHCAQTVQLPPPAASSLDRIAQASPYGYPLSLHPRVGSVRSHRRAKSILYRRPTREQIRRQHGPRQLQMDSLVTRAIRQHHHLSSQSFNHCLLVIRNRQRNRVNGFSKHTNNPCEHIRGCGEVGPMFLELVEEIRSL